MPASTERTDVLGLWARVLCLPPLALPGGQPLAMRSVYPPIQTDGMVSLVIMSGDRVMGSYAALLQQLFREYNLCHFEQELGFIIWKLQSGNITESEARRFLWHIRPYVEKQQAFFNVLPPPPAANLFFSDGPFDVEFGTTEHKLRVGLRLLREVRHLLVAGAPGTGKTVFLRNLIIKVCRLSKQLGRRIPIVVIDPKRDFVDIAKLAGGEWVYLEAGENARFSWEKPEGVPLDAWVSGLCQDLAARLGFIAARVGLSKVFHFLIDALTARS
jgi:hypothetical protein